MELLSIYYVYVDLVEDDKPDLSIEDRRRRDRRIPRIGLKRYPQSSFYWLFHSGCDQGLLNCCALDHKAFDDLLAIFKPAFEAYTVDKKTGRIRKKKSKKGRKKSIDAVGALAMVLFWYRTRGTITRGMALAFGMTASPMYMWIKFSRRVLLYVIQYHPDAKVSPPTGEETQQYADAIAAKYPDLKKEKVWGAIDGLKLHVQQSADWYIQNMFYNGWVSGTYVNCVFVFAPDGKIKMCVINAPGTMHDSTISEYGLYEAMEDVYIRHKGKVVVDAAFRLKTNNDFLIESSNQATQGSKKAIKLNQAATSVRQLAEHGMRMIQGQFPRVKDNMRLDVHDPVERRICLHLMVHLYNFQTARIGINHMLNTFMSKTAGFASYGVTATGQPKEIDSNANTLFDRLRRNNNDN